MILFLLYLTAFTNTHSHSHTHTHTHMDLLKGFLRCMFISLFFFSLIYGHDAEIESLHETLGCENKNKTKNPKGCFFPQLQGSYTVEVRNIFKGLDLTDRIPDELWTEVHDIVQETGSKTIPKKKKCKKAKWLSEEAL